MTTIDHDQKTHSRFGASSMKRLLSCPGSYKMCEGLPNFTSAFADEGTFAHEILEYCLKQKLDVCPKIFKDKVIEDEMFNTINTALEFLSEFKNDKIILEQKILLDFIHPDIGGTNDISIIRQFDSLFIFDFKYGAGVPVEVENNYQLMTYALGFAWDNELNDFHDFGRVVLGIIQPRCYHIDGPIRIWEISIEQLKEFANTLKKGVIECQKSDAKLSTGDHCRFCNAKSFCPELHKTSLEVACSDFTTVEVLNPEHLTIEQISKVLEKEKLLISFIDACKERALNFALNGNTVPNMKLVHKRSKKIWNALDDEIECKLLNLPKITPENVRKSELKSVSAISKILGKKDEHLLENLITVIQGELDIAPLDDKRKTAKNSAAIDFEGV